MNLGEVQGNQENRTSRISNTAREIRTQLIPQFAKSIGRVWGSAPKQANAVHSSRGDTMVEVMISAAVLSLAMIAAYTLAGSSLRNGTAANQRSEALALAQSQIDLLVGAQNNDANFASDYQINAPFCINQDATKNTTVGTDNLCDNYNNTIYNIGASYSSTSQVFTIAATWATTDGQDNLKLYYKLAGNY